jgi:hypothetical protein
MSLADTVDLVGSRSGRCAPGRPAGLPSSRSQSRPAASPSRTPRSASASPTSRSRAGRATSPTRPSGTPHCSVTSTPASPPSPAATRKPSRRPTRPPPAHPRRGEGLRPGRRDRPPPPGDVRRWAAVAPGPISPPGVRLPRKEAQQPGAAYSSSLRPGSGRGSTWRSIPSRRRAPCHLAAEDAVFGSRVNTAIVCRSLLIRCWRCRA